MRPDLRSTVRSLGEYLSGMFPEEEPRKTKPHEVDAATFQLLQELSQKPRN